jgi:hypothetical protein
MGPFDATLCKERRYFVSHAHSTCSIHADFFMSVKHLKKAICNIAFILLLVQYLKMTWTEADGITQKFPSIELIVDEMPIFILHLHMNHSTDSYLLFISGQHVLCCRGDVYCGPGRHLSSHFRWSCPHCCLDSSQV